MHKTKIIYSIFSLAKLFFCCLVVVAFSFQTSSIFAQDVAETEEEIETLEQKAQNYQRMISLKQQQQMSLQNQLEMMDVQIEKFNNDIDLLKQDIERNQLEIKELQAKIEFKEKDLKKVKGNLAEILRIYHQIDQELGMEILSSDGNFSKILNQSEYIDQTSQKVDDVLRELKETKLELEKQQEKFHEKRVELKAKEDDMKEELAYVSNEKLSKSILLEKTQGEEKKYQTLLERVEKQKQELIGDLDALSSETRGEIDKIIRKADKPKSGKASTSWYYAQDDKRWAYKRIGLSSSLMKDYGCAVSSLSMVFSYHKEKISPGKLSSQPIFYRDLIVWPQNWKSLKLKTTTSHGNINWSTVKKELKKDNPVIVFVRSNGGAGHYVVIHSRDKKGNYVVHDPLFGPNLYLETTKKLVGAIYDSSVTIDQMLIYED